MSEVAKGIVQGIAIGLLIVSAAWGAIDILHRLLWGSGWLS